MWTQSAVNIKNLLHERLNSDRVDFQQDEGVFLVEVSHVGEFLQQFGEDTSSGWTRKNGLKIALQQYRVPTSDNVQVSCHLYNSQLTGVRVRPGPNEKKIIFVCVRLRKNGIHSVQWDEVPEIVFYWVGWLGKSNSEWNNIIYNQKSFSSLIARYLTLQVR